MALSRTQLDTMAQFVGEAIMEFRPHLKQSTLKSYVAQMKKLLKKSGEPHFEFLQHPEDVKLLVADYAYTTQRNIFACCATFLQAIDIDGDLEDTIEYYVAWRDELNQRYADEQKTGIISTKQAPNFISMDELEAFVKKLKRDVSHHERMGDTNIRLVATLFQILIKYPLRNDLAGLTLVSKAGEKKLTQEDKMARNYLVKDGDEFIIVDNVYKTSKKYGENRIPIKDTDLNTALRSFIRNKKLKLGDVMFDITSNYLSQLLIKYSQQYIQKNVSTTMIRKIVTSHKFLESKEAQEKHAKVLGHSVGVENDIYIKKHA